MRGGQRVCVCVRVCVCACVRVQSQWELIQEEIRGWVSYNERAGGRAELSFRIHFKHSHPKPIETGCFTAARKEGSFIHSSFEIRFIPMGQITYLARQLDLWDQAIIWTSGVQPVHVWQLRVVMTGERSSCFVWEQQWRDLRRLAWMLL